MSDPASNLESSRQEPSRCRFLKGGATLGAALVAGTGRPLAERTCSYAANSYQVG
jgi:hypothetical protein